MASGDLTLLLSNDRQEAPLATTRVAVNAMTVRPNVMRYGSPPLRQTAFVGAAHFGANPEKAQPRRCKRRNINQKCGVVPRCPANPHGSQTVPKANPQRK